MEDITDAEDINCLFPKYLVRPEYSPIISKEHPEHCTYQYISDEYFDWFYHKYGFQLYNLRVQSNDFRMQHPEFYMQVPCGHCFACRYSKTRSWALRLVHESRFWTEAVFITLTYDDDHVPLIYSKKLGHEVTNLDVEDTKKFWKRLRERTHKKFKYYLCGEYGDNTFRSHYHAIVFGLSRNDESDIRLAWKLGNVTCGDVTLKSIQYVTGYVQKKLYRDVADHVYDGRTPPFACQSKGFGLKFAKNLEEQACNELSYKLNGIKYSVPKYYKEKLDELKLNLCIRSEVRKFDDIEKFEKMTETEFTKLKEDLKTATRQRIADFRARLSLNRRSKI